MECEFNHTPYKRRLDNYLGHKHLTASMRPRKYSENTPSRWSSGELEDAFRSTRVPAVLDYEELRGLSDPGPRGYAHSIHIIG
jgi:hypothetical protein